MAPEAYWRGVTPNIDREVADEVRLVAIAQLSRDVGPAMFRHALGHLGRLVQPVPPDDPFRTDADVVLEEPLELPRAHRRCAGEGVDPEQAGIAGHAVDHLAELGHVRRPARPP